MKPTEQREREIKFEVPDESWALPTLSGLVPPGGSVTRSSIVLESTYHDTEDLSLLRNRLTLRRRTGDDDTGWHLKIPDGDARTEVRLPLEGRGMPATLRQLTLGIRAGAPLRPVARLQTHRDVHLIHAVDGTPLAELVVDVVTATRMGATAELTQWREIEVELKDGDEALLRRASKWLRKAGVVPATYGSKLTRALGDAVPPASEAATDDLSAVVRAYLDVQHAAILTGDLALRREQDAIHPTRVATRRYRSVLKIFADLFDDERAAALDAELQWYASVLGAVRDLQVLGDHLRTELAALPDDLVLGPVSARLEQTLGKELGDARRALATAMRGRRYLALLKDLHAWSTDPSLVGGRGRSAARVEKYLLRAEKKFRTRLAHAQQLDAADPAKDEALHRARKAAKRARYTAELGEPVLGRTARVAVKRAKKLQTDLGDRQDAVVAVAYLRRLGALAGSTAGENGFTFGILIANELNRRR